MCHVTRWDSDSWIEVQHLCFIYKNKKPTQCYGLEYDAQMGSRQMWHNRGQDRNYGMTRTKA